MSGNPPHLPILPTGFGTDSSYPPIPGSTRITASQPKPSVSAVASSPRPGVASATAPASAAVPISTGSYRPVGPPLPPLPPGALEQEQQRLRYQSASYSSSPSLRPGHLVHAPTPPPPQPPSSSGHFVGGFTSPPPQHNQSRTGTPVAAARPPQSMPTPSYGRVFAAYAPPPPGSMSHSQSIASNMQNLSIQNEPHAHASSARRASANDAFAAGPSAMPRPPQPPPAASASNSNGPPSLSAPLPDMASLAALRDRARDDKQRINWAKQMLKYVERNFSDGSKISEPYLVRWTDEAISIITRNASSQNPEPEALYLRGDLQASGAFPTYIAKSLKEAFNDFELSARLGWAPSWFRIGRDYEVLGDLPRAVHAYDRGVQAGDVGSIYRMGMANLLGQLDLPVNHARAIAMLRDAADKADLDTPQPSYIYGMLLAGEFSHVDIPPHLLKPSSVSGSVEDEARRRIQRTAYLNFAPAQYKCGWLNEYAQLGCAFDPLLSVQYYSLASQGGEIEADMALSKWFLCGAEQYFEKNETLAYTFADKAARKGLASAEFALGYYHEVGVGTERNVDIARKWYKKAAAKDNADARERLQALQGPQAHGMSRQQHEAVMDDKLVRKRTQAKMLSDREGRSPMFEHDQYFGGPATAGGRRSSGAVPNNAAAAAGPSSNGRMGGGNFELSRKKTMKMVEETAAGRRRPNYGGFESRPPPPAASQQQPAAPPPPVPTTTQYQPPQVRPIAATPQPIPTLQPSSTPAPGPGGRITSGTHPSQTPGRHGAGYTLQDGNPPPPASNTTSAYSTPHHTAASSYLNASSNSSTTTSTNVSSSNGGVSDDAAAGGPGGKKPYNTFAEMGFAPQKQKKEECVIA